MQYPHWRGDRGRSGGQRVIHVLPTGVWRGLVKAPCIIVEGTVHGDLHAGEKVEFGECAVINGDVTTPIWRSRPVASSTERSKAAPVAGLISRKNAKKTEFLPLIFAGQRIKCSFARAKRQQMFPVGFPRAVFALSFSCFHYHDFVTYPET
jgi:hypothetical protein